MQLKRDGHYLLRGMLKNSSPLPARFMGTVRQNGRTKYVFAVMVASGNEVVMVKSSTKYIKEVGREDNDLQ